MTIPFSYFGPQVSSGGTFPTESKVLSGTVFGPSNNLTGNLVLPAEPKVYYGIGYGASGSEFTGSYLPQGLGGVPGASTPFTSSSGPGPNIKHVYIDQSIGSGGTGTDVDPYGDFESALAAESSQTNGTQFNIKSGTVIQLTAEISGQLGGGVWASGGATSPLIFRGYDSVKDDGGRFDIACATNTSAWSAGATFDMVCFIDGVIRDSGTAALINGGDRLTFVNMEFTGSSANRAVEVDTRSRFVSCHFHGLTGSVGAFVGDASYFYDCFFDSARVQQYEGTFDGCFFIEKGIQHYGSFNPYYVTNCSFYGGPAANTSTAVYMFSSGTQNAVVKNCLCENFGNLVRDTSTNAFAALVAGNSCFSVANEYTNVNSAIFQDNETLSASPFEKTGLATFANRHNFFAPANEGNVRTGGYSPTGTPATRGAVGFAGSTTSTVTKHPLVHR